MKTADELNRDMSELCNEAMRLGATRAVALPAADIVVDPRAKLKCQVPLCSHYGDLMCPPNTPPVAEFKESLGQYNHAILVQVEIPLKDLPVANSKGKYLDSALDPRKKLHDIIHRLESLSLQRGFFFAAGFIGGSCPLCDECVGRSGAPCRHPFKARPAMEAMGIDVMYTALNAGIELGFGSNAGRSWLGLLLVT